MSIKVKHYDNGQIKRLEIMDGNGNMHNPYGPAYQSWYETGQERCKLYYLHGELFTEKEFNEQRNTVLVTCNGKEVRISRQSAEAMNLI